MTRVRVLIVPVLLTALTWAAFIGDRAPGTSAARDGFPLDDAWIHMVYARSLAREGGFHYNPGVPEAGMTSPLWVIALAPVHLITHDDRAAVMGAKILSLVSGMVSVAALGLLAFELGESAPVAVAVATLAALDPALTFARTSGMEPALFTALVLLALTFACRGRALAAALCCGLGVLARPEGVLVAPALAFLLATAKPRLTIARGAAAAALAALPPLLYMAYCLHTTGRPLPNSFYVKFARVPPSVELLAEGWREYVAHGLPYFTLQAGSIAALVGVARLLRRGPRPATAALATGVLLFAGTLSTRVFSPGHYFYWERWLVPAFPFLLLTIVAGLDEVRSGCVTLWRRRPAWLAPLAWGPAAALAVAVMWGWPSEFAARADRYAWNCENIEALDVAAARWIDARLPRDAVVAVNDAGAARYFGNRRIVDILGLNDHALLEAPQPTAVLARSGVTHLVVFPSWFGGVTSRPDLTPLDTLRAEHFTLCAFPQDVMVIYRWNRR